MLTSGQEIVNLKWRQWLLQAARFLIWGRSNRTARHASYRVKSGRKEPSMANLQWIQSVMGQYQLRLLRYARRIAGSEHSAEDVVQEVFARLCAASPPPEDARLAQWLFTVCRNRAIDVRRKDDRMTTLSDNEVHQASPAMGPAEAAEHRDLASAAMRILQTLPANRQEVIRLRFQEGFKYRQIAEITGLSASNVGFLIHTAIASIRAQFGTGAAPAL